jgi:hypothetical protein
MDVHEPPGVELRFELGGDFSHDVSIHGLPPALPAW